MEVRLKITAGNKSRVADSEEAKRIEELSERIEELESTLRKVAEPYSELVRQLSMFQDTVQKYFRLMDLYQKHGVVSIDTILPQVKDPISKEIMRILLDKPGLNISEVTEELRARRGSSSRRIVRDRLVELVAEGLVKEKSDRKEKTYEISEEVVRKWSQVLGLSK
jgi:DNA-binding transcriptional ArsR family regulator